MLLCHSMKKDPYSCPACGYFTEVKASMRYHLYMRSEPCPTSRIVIDLTDEIKAFIMKNRVYHVPAMQPPPAAHTTINNIQTVHSYISNIPPMKKILCFLMHNDISTTPLDQRISKGFSKNIRRLESNPKSYVLKEADFLETINGASTNNRIENMNILYDKRDNKISVYDGRWRSYLVERGVKVVLVAIQQCYFDAYECYLIRNLHCHDVAGRQLARVPFEELLMEYYKFISHFDLVPFIKDKIDRDILTATFADDGEGDAAGASGGDDEGVGGDDEGGGGDGDGDDDGGGGDGDGDGATAMHISDMYMAKFDKVRDSVSKQERLSVKKTVVDIIKCNCRASAAHVNAQVAELFRMDSDFKQLIMQAKPMRA